MLAKPALLAVSPKLPQSTDLDTFKICLTFLKDQFEITWLDSLQFFKPNNFAAFYQQWMQFIQHTLPDYQAYIGFSLGGVILQQCLTKIEPEDKKIILISPPSVMTTSLSKKLRNVITHIENSEIEQGLNLLYQYVFPENKKPFNKSQQVSWQTIAQRVIFGIEYVLQNHQQLNVTQSSIEYLQLVGLKSQLVTAENMIQTPTNRTVIVPAAGMRVLEDNPEFSKNCIKQWLKSK